MTDVPQQSPTTTEGIAIHLVYINEHLKSLDNKMDAIANNTVNRDEWFALLKRVETVETNNKTQQADAESNALVKKLVFGCVALILVAVVSALIYLVLKK